jgi:hypothetical protein
MVFVSVFLPAVVVVAGCKDANNNLGAKAPAGKPSPDVASPALQPPPPPPPPPDIVTTPSSPGTIPSQRPQIELSTGVALPQTGPTGILMSFSVEYQIVVGRPDPSATYVWVVERQQGPPAREPVRLSDHGTLAILISGWRPTEGPFSAHLEDRSGNKLSRSVDLQ